jgi:hypothetical protein
MNKASSSIIIIIINIISCYIHLHAQDQESPSSDQPMDSTPLDDEQMEKI